MRRRATRISQRRAPASCDRRWRPRRRLGRRCHRCRRWPRSIRDRWSRAVAPAPARTPDYGRPDRCRSRGLWFRRPRSRRPGRLVDAAVATPVSHRPAAPRLAGDRRRTTTADTQRLGLTRAPPRAHRAASRSRARCARDISGDVRLRRVRQRPGHACSDPAPTGGVIALAKPCERGRRIVPCRRIGNTRTRPITDRSSPTTSDTASVSVAPRQARGEPSTFDRREVLAHGVERVNVGAPGIMRSTVRRLSESDMPAAGTAASADAPPDSSSRSVSVEATWLAIVSARPACRRRCARRETDGSPRTTSTRERDRSGGECRLR